jgi:hypothetical protein
VAAARPPAPPVRVRRPRGRRVAVVVGVVTAVVLAATGVVLAYANGAGSPGPGPSPSASAKPGAVQPSRQPLPGVSAGGSCGWQDVGTQEQLTDGRRVRCEYQPADGTYRWKLMS